MSNKLGIKSCITSVTLIAILASLLCIHGTRVSLSAPEAEEHMGIQAQRQLAHKTGVLDETNDDGIDPHLKRQVDFNRLKQQNSDVSRWMYVPGTGLDSPVMQEPRFGEYFYDLRGFNKVNDGSGSFTMPKEPEDPETGKDAEDARTMILGHKMAGYYGNKDWQFAQLPVRWAHEAGANAYPYVYLYYPDHAERWVLWAGADALGTDMVYKMPYKLGSVDYHHMLDFVAAHSRYQRFKQPDSYTRTLMLSTCNQGNDGAWRRFFLTYVPDETYTYSSGTLVDEVDSHASWMFEEKCRRNHQDLMVDDKKEDASHGQ